MEEMVTVAEGARILGVHPQTLRRLIKQGQIPALVVGRSWRLRPSDLVPGFQEAPKPQKKARKQGRFARLAAGIGSTGGRSA